MAATRAQAIVRFILMPMDESDKNSINGSSLAWELLTHGFTKRLFKQAAVSLYERKLRPIFTDETPDDDAKKVSLAAYGLLDWKYVCKLKVGKEEKDPEVPKSSKDKKILKFMNDEDKPVTVPELAVQIKIPRKYETSHEWQAIAMSIKNRDEVMLYPEPVHVKWSTDVTRLKALFHEAQMYERLRLAEAGVTPKFYGYYINYRRFDAFGISVFDKSSRLPDAQDKDKIVSIL